VETELLRGKGSFENLRKEISTPLGRDKVRQTVFELMEREHRMRLAAEIKASHVGLDSLLSDANYLSRIYELVVERIRGGPDAPSLRIDPRRLNAREAKELLGGQVNLGLIYGAESIYFQDTVLAFQTDEVVSRAEGLPSINVLGVHYSWLAGEFNAAKKSLVVDDTGRVKEVEFEQPVPLNIVQTLHLPMEQETEMHKQISSRFEKAEVLQINPYENSSERADKKMLAHQLWKQHQDRIGREIPSPLSCLVTSPSSPIEILKKLKLFLGEMLEKRGPLNVGVVVQPNVGTEGYKVNRFNVDLTKIEEIALDHPIAHYVDSLLSENNVLVREERGNTRFLPAKNAGYRTIAFRLNVCWNGLRFVAESGYAQISRDEETFPASVGRGGSIVDLHRAFVGLYLGRDDDWTKILPTEADIREMKRVAVDAAVALNFVLDERSYLKMMGIDVVLEAIGQGQEIELTPVVLEANARPAGLNRLRLIAGISGEKPASMVSYEIFDYVRRARQVYARGSIDRAKPKIPRPSHVSARWN